MISLILIYFIAIYATWLFYVAVMALRAVHRMGGIPRLALPFAYTTLAIGLWLDFILNILMSLPLLEPPQWQRSEFLLSPRLTRLVAQGGWRAAEARFWCRNFLEPFDPGHCA